MLVFPFLFLCISEENTEEGETYLNEYDSRWKGICWDETLEADFCSASLWYVSAILLQKAKAAVCDEIKMFQFWSDWTCFGRRRRRASWTSPKHSIRGNYTKSHPRHASEVLPCFLSRTFCPLRTLCDWNEQLQCAAALCLSLWCLAFYFFMVWLTLAGAGILTFFSKTVKTEGHNEGVDPPCLKEDFVGIKLHKISCCCSRHRPALFSPNTPSDLKGPAISFTVDSWC